MSAAPTDATPTGTPIGRATHMIVPNFDNYEGDAHVRAIADRYRDSQTARSAILEFLTFLNSVSHPAPQDVATMLPLPPGLDAADRQVVVTALYEYMFQRQSYRDGVPRRDANHDDCCPTATSRQAEWDKQRSVLDKQVRHLRALIDVFEPLDNEQVAPQEGK